MFFHSSWLRISLLYSIKNSIGNLVKIALICAISLRIYYDVNQMERRFLQKVEPRGDSNK
jgi:small basic protein